jgi:inner membrane protein
MDSITHIVTGACIGEIFAGKKLGKKAMLWGAATQTLPDIDVITSWWMNIPDSLLAHRGFTHSFLFAFISTAIIAFFAERWHRPHNITYIKWYLFILLEIGVHLFLDVQTAYGTGLLEPFNHGRFSLNTIFVADPFFTIIPLIVCIVLLILRKKNNRRMLLAKTGIAVCVAYLFYCWYNKFNIEQDTKLILAKQNIKYTKHFSTPAPLNNWLWYIVAGDEKGYYTGYRSVFDTKDTIELTYSPVNDSLLLASKNNDEVNKLIRFSDGFYTAEKWGGDTVVLNDLRFEKQAGWKDGNSRYVFYYYLQSGGSNDLVIQRGRFEKIDENVFKTLITRIKGN